MGWGMERGLLLVGVLFIDIKIELKGFLSQNVIHLNLLRRQGSAISNYQRVIGIFTFFIVVPFTILCTTALLDKLICEQTIVSSQKAPETRDDSASQN